MTTLRGVVVLVLAVAAAACVEAAQAEATLAEEKANLRAMNLVAETTQARDGRMLSWDEACYETLKTRTSCENLDEVLSAVDFTSYETVDPYPEEQGYVTEIDETQNCYVEFVNPEARESDTETIRYNLLTLSPSEATSQNTSGTVYLTHVTPCGACSTLEDLALYLNVTDLTSPVRQCAALHVLGIISPERAKTMVLNCLENVGFTQPSCRYIWYYNTRSTLNECASVCLAYSSAPNNDPVKNFYDVNYCAPYRAFWNPLGCKNKIQRAPDASPDNACKDFQYENGEYRLNSCLQCDECRSGPIFQKVAGRTRRDSGIASQIARPDSVEIDHDYGFACAV
ncbi:Hypothetical Protein FCC1311_071242 [Hondaea fermentalgiana]|uniref:Uncharacterized protein n=1 Tax=Hondaea fermentalgiana TaxID=2315210 RepID=A0A2R5GQJ9_9STRA|nr:Hypothetical Protein FCC1311_071242 [Hondaea fermentalgiana]|eukprot:GBG30903.1 Hypothetical Protein FCC1311_071242 [Hondaea fermentalgiana]